MTIQFSPHDADIPAQPVKPQPIARQRRVNTVETAPKQLYRDYIKRGIDIFATLLALPIVVPVVGFIALLIMMDGHNPFYSQLRVGRNGRNFRMWKLRTMVPNADALLDSYLAANPAAQAEWISTQKLKNDPRITWVGRLLRKCSIDELPQLLNVLNGTMSLVGPRPMMVCQRGDYHGQSYFKLRPGVTGAWQVSDRNACSFSGRVSFDDTYYADLSAMTDLRILFKTVWVVVRGTGY